MTAHPDPAALGTWLDSLDADQLLDLVVLATERIPGFSEWLDGQRVADDPDPIELLALVNRGLAPTRRFYDYRQANDYAHDAYDTVELLRHIAAERSTPALLPIIERAITLTTRAILKSDDSSGLQGDLVRSLLDAHAEAARTASPKLTQAEQTRLITWIVKYRYGGQQDFFDPDIVAYAPALSPKSVERYRDAITAIDLGEYGRYPLTRLAVLDADRDAIVAAHGGEPRNEMLAASLVADLEEAGLHDDAVAYARIGIAMGGRGWDRKLITFLVDDAIARGAADEAVELRRDWFARHPSSTSYSALRETADQLGRWDAERDAAEDRLAAHDPESFVTYLIDEGRGEQAWDFARVQRSSIRRADVWLKLCADRAKAQPADTLPIYRLLISDTLIVTDVRNYKAAARMLKTMRDVAAVAGPEHTAEFETFLAQTVEQNRRRTRCIEEFAKAKLIPRR